MNTVLIALSILAAGPVELSVTPIRGETVVGTLDDVTSQQLVLNTPDGRLTLPANELLTAEAVREWAGPPPRRAETILVTLVDGSRLHATGYTVASGRAKVTKLDGVEVTIPTRAIAHVSLLPLAGPTFSQWEEVLAADRQSDAIVIRKSAAAPNGQEPATVALDAPEGVLGDIDASTVGFDFDGSSVNVPRRKVQGVVYFHRTTSTPRDPICRVVVATGSRWQARSLKLEDDGLHGISVSGVRFTVPLAQLEALDYSVGNVDYLSDLPRESVVWKPRRSAGNPPSAHRWFSPKFDTGLYGSVLKLDDEPYEKGLAMHSHAEVSYRLTKRYRHLLARVGVDDGFRYEADLELRIYGDGEVIFSRQIKGQDPSFDLELDMQGIRRLKIVVGYGADDSERSDNLNLCNARLTK